MSYFESFDAVRRMALAEWERKKVSPETVTARLTGFHATWWRTLVDGRKRVNKNSILIEALTVYFACAGLKEHNDEKISIIVRMTGDNDEPLGEVNLFEYFDLPELAAYHAKQK